MPELTCRLESVSHAPGVGVAALQGAIDPKNALALETALSRTPYRTLVLDLGGIRYINSAGLGCLVNLSDELALRGGRLCMANLQPKVKIVFDLMGVAQFFRLFKSVDTALAAVAPKRRLVRKG